MSQNQQDQAKNQKLLEKTDAKRPHFLLHCLAGAAAVGLLISLANVQKEAGALSQHDIDPTIMTGGLTGSYLSGRFAANQGDFDNANYYLARTQKFDPENKAIAGYAYRMKLITGDMIQAEHLAKSLYKSQDTESNPEIMVLLSSVQDKNYKEATEVLRKFSENGFNVVLVPLIEAWLEYGEGKLKQPVKMDKALEQISEFAPFIYFQSAVINDIAGYEEVAIEQYNEALKLSRSMPYRVVEMLANLHERRGEWEKAEEVYQQYMEESPDSLLVASVDKDRIKRGKAPERMVKSVAEGVAEILFSTASILHNEGLNEEALIYVQEVLYLNPDFVPAKLMHGSVLEDLEQYEAALEVFDDLPRGTSYFYKGKLREAYVLNALGRTDEALTLLSKMSGELPGRYQIHLAKGDILMREKRFEEAVDAYTAAMADVGELRAEQWPILYARGISAERSKQWDMAEKDFLKALELEPNQPDVMNYLGYSWLVQDMNHDKAKEMIEKAVKARPTDGHIIDSMGWALYTLGEYDEAVLYLERAIELMPTDPTVNDHLGDVYWRMDRRNEARFQWNRALRFDPEPEQVEEINQKLEAGLPETDKNSAEASAEPDLSKPTHAQLP